MTTTSNNETIYPNHQIKTNMYSPQQLVLRRVKSTCVSLAISIAFAFLGFILIMADIGRVATEYHSSNGAITFYGNIIGGPSITKRFNNFADFFIVLLYGVIKIKTPSWNGGTSIEEYKVCCRSLEISQSVEILLVFGITILTACSISIWVQSASLCKISKKEQSKYAGFIKGFSIASIFFTLFTSIPIVVFGFLMYKEMKKFYHEQNQTLNTPIGPNNGFNNGLNVNQVRNDYIPHQVGTGMAMGPTIASNEFDTSDQNTSDFFGANETIIDELSPDGKSHIITKIYQKGNRVKKVVITRPIDSNPSDNSEQTNIK